MAITVRYFAALRDELGKARDQIEPDETIMTVERLWDALWPQRARPANTLIAVNQTYARPDQPVRDGDEVAFFPPVTGG